MGKRNFTNRSKRSIKRNRRNKRRLTNRYNKSRRGGYTKSKIRGGMDRPSNTYVPGSMVPVISQAGPATAQAGPATAQRGPATAQGGPATAWGGPATAWGTVRAQAAPETGNDVMKVYYQWKKNKGNGAEEEDQIPAEKDPAEEDPAEEDPVALASRARDSRLKMVARKINMEQEVVEALKWSGKKWATECVKTALSEQNTVYKQALEKKRVAHEKLQARMEKIVSATHGNKKQAEMDAAEAEKEYMAAEAEAVEAHRAAAAQEEDKMNDPNTKENYTTNINAWISQMLSAVHQVVNPPPAFNTSLPLLKETIEGTCKTVLPLKQLHNRNHEISESSVLFVIDMQNDFVGPADFQTTPNMDMFGARFAVSEGPYIDHKMVKLIEDWPGKVILSRDYHPHNHCSFASSGKGNYPTHCVQGTRGSYFTDNMEKALMTRFMDRTKRNNTYIVFKGCWESIDSYGAAKYKLPDGGWTRINGTLPADVSYIKQPQNPAPEVATDINPTPDSSVFNGNNVLNSACQTVSSCSKIDLTGSFYLQCSALTELGLSLDNTPELIKNPSFKQAFLDAIRSGPDVNAINEKNEKLDRRKGIESSNTINKRIEEIITGDPNIYVVGLALDYCCTDTAVNLSKARYTNVNLVMNLCRPPVIPLGVPGLTKGEPVTFADDRHKIAEGSDLRWLTKRLAVLRAEKGSTEYCPVWWLQKEILHTTVNLIWADPA